MFSDRVVFLDLETTGATANNDRITEVGLIQVDGERVVDEWATLVNPGVNISAAIQSLTGITNDMVARAPSFAQIARELYRRLEGRLLVAHNVRFDYGFLRQEFHRLGVRYASRALCTVRLSRKLFPQYPRHNLDTLIARHGISCDARHRALGDARAIWELARCWHRQLSTDTINKAVSDLIQTPAVPVGMDSEAFDEVPETPGVYIFHGEDDVVLYVGKSIHLRSRIMSHFSGDHRTSRDTRIAQQVKRIEWIPTAGELGTLIRESHLIKQHAPVYNRRLRRAAELCSWHWRSDQADGSPQLISERDLDPSELGDFYGLFRSRRSAIEALREIANAHELCPILIGLEKGRGPCFAYQLKRCRGACIGAESRTHHAMRLSQALASIRMRPWPFKGRIGVRETDSTNASPELHVLDRWCYLGTVRSENDLHDLVEARVEPNFDADTYRILTRFFSKPASRYTVVELAARSTAS